MNVLLVLLSTYHPSSTSHPKTLLYSSITQSLLFLQSIVQINLDDSSRSLNFDAFSTANMQMRTIHTQIGRIAESEPRNVVFHAASPEQRFSP
jgi:hypothetical protein